MYREGISLKGSTMLVLGLYTNFKRLEVFTIGFTSFTKEVYPRGSSHLEGSRIRGWQYVMA